MFANGIITLFLLWFFFVLILFWGGLDTFLVISVGFLGAALVPVVAWACPDSVVEVRFNRVVMALVTIPQYKTTPSTVKTLPIKQKNNLKKNCHISRILL
jgi:hypothetical protein